MGASGYTDYTYFGDMANIAALYNVYKKAGMKNIHTWFTKDGNQIVFPKHYIYHKYSQNLYYYDPWKPNYYIRRVNQPNDLYRKLGF